MVKVFLDAGHGGVDAGASGNGLFEKDITLHVVKAVEAMLNTMYDGVETKLSRIDDKFMSLTNRTKAANEWGADFLISVHINSAENVNAQGFESFSHSTLAGNATKAFQNVMHSAIMKQCPEFEDRGQRQQDFHMLRESNMPAVLTESGFISSAHDANLLKSSDFIERLVLGHTNGIAQIAGLKRRSSALLSDYKDCYAAKDIDEIKQLGIMQGYPDGTFKPDRPVSRGDLAIVLNRLIKHMEGRQNDR